MRRALQAPPCEARSCGLCTNLAKIRESQALSLFLRAPCRARGLNLLRDYGWRLSGGGAIAKAKLGEAAGGANSLSLPSRRWRGAGRPCSRSDRAPHAEGRRSVGRLRNRTAPKCAVGARRNLCCSAFPAVRLVVTLHPAAMQGAGCVIGAWRWRGERSRRHPRRY